MGILLVYMLKSAFSLALFYLFYRLLLSRDTFHRINRMLLLLLMPLSCLLPLIELNTQHPTLLTDVMQDWESWMLMMQEMPDARLAEKTTTFSWSQLLAGIYLIGVVGCLLHTAGSLIRLLRLLRQAEAQPLPYIQAKGIKLLVREDADTSPFSWMNYIVVNRKDLMENGREILLHEVAHVRLHHSWDLLLCDLCCLLQWFNPAIWLLRQELQTLHEYEADSYVLSQGVNARQYQLLLIKKAVGTRLYSMANNLNHSNLKKRITMMLKEKSNRWARVKYLYVLPVAALSVAAFARPEVVATSEEISAAKVNDLSAMVETLLPEKGQKALLPQRRDTLKPRYTPIPVGKAPVKNDKGDVCQVPDEMPEFPGGTGALMKYLMENVRYPAEAMAKKQQGRVVVRFVVDKDGSIRDAKVIRAIDPLLDAEAVRVVESMPKWKPARVKGEDVNCKFTVPITFSLTKGSDSADSSEGPSILVKGTVVDSEGKPISGALINIVGSTRGTVTDANGNYSLRVSSKQDSLMVVRFVGMEPSIVRIGTGKAVLKKE